jgi:hypothetical protein
MGVPLLDLLPFLEPLPLIEGTGLDLREPVGVFPGLPRPDDEPDTDLEGACPALKSPGPTNPCPDADWTGIRPNGDQGNFVRTRPIQVFVKTASRSRSSRRLSNAVRYLSYESLKDRSTFDEKISSPLGLVLGGIVGIGTEAAFRLEIDERVGDGGLGDVVEAVILPNDNGLRERRGG